MTDKVLELPELLENILLHLPMRKLLLAQRVSKHWHQLIQACPSLQQNLFFTSFAPESKIVYDSDHYFLSYDEDLQGYEDDEGEYESQHCYWHDSNNPEIPFNVMVNPVIRALSLQLSYHYEADITENEAFAKLDSLLPESWTRSEASWRRMMHSQPGSAGMLKVMKVSYDRDGGHEMASIRFNDGDGLVLGHSVDMLLSGPSEAHDSLFCEEADSSGTVYEFSKMNLEIKDAAICDDTASVEWLFSEWETQLGEQTKQSVLRRQTAERSI